ncbi:MAG: sensor histidine kinase [Candidatus Limnocylindrales bacterium]
MLAWIGPLPGRRPDRAWFRPSSWKDLGLALAAGAAALVGAVVSVSPASHEPNVGLGVFVVSSVPIVLLAWRPRLCEWFLAVSLACWVIAGAAGSSGGDFAVIVAVYTMGTHRTWRRTAAAVLLAAGATVVVDVAQGASGRAANAVFTGTVATVGYAMIAAVGLYLGKRRAYVRTLVERTEDLERERDLKARQAVAVERARIARELHDVVAHHVSVMVIQAGAAQASLPPGADAAGQALEAIRETGREAMAEMRRLLGLLRADESLESGAPGATSGAPPGDAARSPQPGMTDLEALAGRTREAGVDVTVEVVGAPRHIPAAVELSAYRVAQEALTNTLRHAGPGARARLSLRFEPEALALEVTDDGHGKPAVESVERSRAAFGHGLVGMRERVGLFGGQFEVGPMAGGGYRVMARFPLSEGSEIDGDLPGSAGEPNRAPEVRQ